MILLIALRHLYWLTGKKTSPFEVISHHKEKRTLALRIRQKANTSEPIPEIDIDGFLVLAVDNQLFEVYTLCKILFEEQKDVC